MAVDTVAEVKARLTIEDVVKPYVQLRRAGRSLVGLCPFHKEKTGSFHVSPERGSWHCFGCGEGGDMFSFIEKAEGLDFKGALTFLAEKAGVRVEYAAGGRERADKRERLREATAKAAQWYQSQLAGSAAEAYAKGRGLAEKTVREWGLGYAKDEWRALLEHLTAQGFSTQELLDAGLIKEADGKPGTYYDRFRNRLLFPIRDAAGRVVAFTGRALATDEQAKYLNSPETDLYHKSEVLFGLDRAKDAIRLRGFTLLVEGQMDVLHAHQAGFENAVALSGTAFTGKHAALMKRYSDNLMLCLDADPAGMKASANAALLALREGLRVKAARLPAGEDPADVISKDAQEFAARVKSAQPIHEFFLAALGEREKDPGRLLAAVEAVVLPLLVAMPSPMERERAAQAVARALGLSPESVRESLRAAGRRQPAGADGKRPGPAASSPAPRRATARETRAEFLAAIVHAYPATPLAARVESEYNRITGDSVAALPSAPESAVFKAEETFGEAPGEDAARELLNAFETAVIREAYQEAVRALRQAEAAGDEGLIREAGERCKALASRLAAL
ncbi:MAG: DNA primase [Patescibacteria group bacterium]|nr:DNA primase [Patescibacteria group bacterium]